MPDRGSVLFASYAGVLGGAERVLLDAVARLGRPAVVACPDGPLAAALGVERARVAERPLRSLRRICSGSAARSCALARRHRPAALRGLGRASRPRAGATAPAPAAAGRPSRSAGAPAGTRGRALGEPARRGRRRGLGGDRARTSRRPRRSCTPAST